MKVIHKHPLAIRWFHWINFPLLIIMTWSGMLIYWANGVYSIRIGSLTIVKFLPSWMYESLDLANRLAEGMAFHFVFMWLFLINGVAYILYTFLSGEWKLLLPNGRAFKDAGLILLNSLKLKKKVQTQTEKYNAAQRVAYSAILVMGVGSVLTGIAIYKPVQFGWLTTIMGGYESARLVHFIITIGYCLFFLIHIIQVIRAGWNNFQAMITGFERGSTELQINSTQKSKVDESA